MQPGDAEGDVDRHQQRNPVGVGLRHCGQPLQKKGKDGGHHGGGQRYREDAPGCAAAHQPPAAGQQKPRQGAEQHQVVVGPAEAVLGAQPDGQHDAAEDGGGGPCQQRDGSAGARRFMQRPRPQRGQGEAREQPRPPCALELRRFRCDAVRGDRFLAEHQRASVGAFRFAQAVGEAHRHVGFFPARHRLVRRRAQADIEAQPHPRRGRGQAHGFAAEGVALRACGELRFQRAADGAVDGVADAGGAVVDEIVVAVAGVLGPGVFGKRGGHRDGLRVVQVQPLDGHAAAAVEVVLQIVAPAESGQEVAHVAADETAGKTGFAHVEEAEVVRQRFAQCGVGHDDGVVAEAFEKDRARLHCGHADPRRGLRGECAGQGKQQRDEGAGQRAPHRGNAVITPHARSRAAYAGDGHRRAPRGSRSGRG